MILLAEGDSGGWRFLDPPWLWLLMAVATVLAAYVLLVLLLRRRYQVRFSNLNLLRSVAPGLWCCAR